MMKWQKNFYRSVTKTPRRWEREKVTEKAVELLFTLHRNAKMKGNCNAFCVMRKRNKLMLAYKLSWRSQSRLEFNLNAHLVYLLYASFSKITVILVSPHYKIQDLKEQELFKRTFSKTISLISFLLTGMKKTKWKTEKLYQSCDTVIPTITEWRTKIPQVNQLTLWQ